MAVVGIMAFMVVAITYSLVLACRDLRGRLRLRALVRDTASRPAAELTPGPVAIEGRVVAAGSPLVSPLEGVACLAHDSVVERLQKQSRQDREWTDWLAVHRDHRRAALAIDDGTGRSPVELREGQLALSAATAGELGPSSPRPSGGTPAARALALAKDRRELGLRWREACLREGDRLFVFGTWSGSAIGRAPDVPVVASTLGREGALRELRGAVLRKVGACVALGLALLFCAAGAVAGLLRDA